MPNLLHLDSSPLSNSVSRELTREYALAWIEAHPDGQTIYRDLAARAPSPIDEEWIAAAYTAPAEITPAQAEKLAESEELIGELERADEYVIGVAMHNFSVPATLKLWVDQIVRNGRTFEYGAGGPKGLLQGKKATVVIASGGVYTEGSPIASMNHAEPFLRTVLGFVGVTDVQFIPVGGTAKLMSAEVDRSAFLKPAVDQVRLAAA